MGAPMRKLYGTTTVGSKGQIVIPAEAREELGIETGDRLYAVAAMHGEGIVLLKEAALEAMVDQVAAQIESFRALKKTKEEKA